MSQNNSRLHEARRARIDEFYTRIEDVEMELGQYPPGTFTDKVVYLNCDDPSWSAFWRHFCMKFGDYGLKGLIATHYTGITEPGKPSFKIEAWRGVDDTNIGHDAYGNESRWVDPKIGGRQSQLIGDGDFRSDECVELLEKSNVVVTNPPFSLLREHVAQIMEYDKKFLIIGNVNGITYKELWPLIQGGHMWLGATGFNKGMFFNVASNWKYAASYDFPREINGKPVCRVSNACWFTAYDNYNAINVNKVKLIPKDYDGVMGVPITFLDKWNPEQFEIVGASDNGAVPDAIKINPEEAHNEPFIHGKKVYKRIFIRRKPDYVETY